MSGLTRRAAVVGGLVGGVAALMGSCLASVVIAALFAARGAPSLQQAAASAPAMLGGIAASSVLLGGAAALTPAVARVPLPPALGLGPARWPLYLAAPVGTLALSPVSDLLMQLMAKVAPDLTLGGLEALVRLSQEQPLWLLLPFVALLPGVGEELFFRGMLQRAFGRGAVAITVSALAFSFIHVDPHHVAGVLPLGFFFAWVAARAGSTWPTIVCHVVNNAAATIAPRFSALEVGYGTDRPMPWQAAVVGVAVAAVAALVIWLLTRERRAPPSSHPA